MPDHHNQYKRVKIVLFHRISPKRDLLWDPIDPKLFEQILKYFSKRSTVVGLDEYFLSPPAKYKKPPVIITFDDGYKDFIEYGFPILKKYSFSASLFVVTDCIDKGLPTWTYTLDQLFFYSKKLETKLADIDFLESKYRIKKWATIEERINFSKNFKQYLKKIPGKSRNIIMKSLQENFDDVNPATGLMLSWDEVRQIQAEGIHIGSHTVTHSPLATIENEGELEY
ncbi:MAG: polysaccharide deacetylase family protein [Bacteroidales bacterium]